VFHLHTIMPFYYVKTVSSSSSPSSSAFDPARRMVYPWCHQRSPMFRCQISS